ncbi:MAG: beta-glucosidase [Deltaproteobacteria bacterium]|nr:MAG: beta-glucosidase [Deltaproteobacteria bacterium]
MRMLLLLALAGCGGPEPAEPRVTLEAWCRADASQVHAEVEDLLDAMSLEAQVAQLSGRSLLQDSRGLWPTATDTEHGIPGFAMVDGPRGAHAATGDATAFPVGMARGATWDPALEQRVGEAIAAEARGKGANVLLAPTVNVLRHPRWGRAQETYGEDPFHIGRMGVGFVEGAQTRLVANAKHFVVNSIEDTRFDVDVAIDEDVLREVYLPQFHDLVAEAHVGSVMSAYNHVNGRPASEQPALLRDILKTEWGFPGFVVSDWVFATETTVGSAMGGLDVEMPVAQVFGEELLDAVESGEVPEAVVREAAARVLRTKLCFDVQEYEPDPNLVLTTEHRALAREVARRAMVLLRNEGALPVEEGSRVLVTGRLADVPNIGDGGSSSVAPPEVVTPLAGLLAAAGSRTVVAADAPSPAELSAADVVIAVVGYTEEDEGEGLIAAGDRAEMGLRQEDVALLVSLADHPRVVVVVEGGSAVTMPWAEEVEAVLMAWYPGMEGGHALAELVYGEASPSGRLPISFPVAEADLPPFDNSSLAVRYDRWHGYTHLERSGTAPHFGFGHGLGYGEVAFGEPSLVAGEASLEVAVSVDNAGAWERIETVQVYVGRDEAPTRRLLRGFAQVVVEAGGQAEARVTVPLDELREWTEDGWRRIPGSYTVWVGPSLDAAVVAGSVDL